MVKAFLGEIYHPTTCRRRPITSWDLMTFSPWRWSSFDGKLIRLGVENSDATVVITRRCCCHHQNLLLPIIPPFLL